MNPRKGDTVRLAASVTLAEFGLALCDDDGEMVIALGGNAEHARLVCFDLFEQGQLRRYPRRTGKRGRPEYLYGVGDFSHVTHTPP